jgi:putative AlgH/UPF0301 family transcriptional regulator
MEEAFCPEGAALCPSFANNSVHLGGPAGPHWTVLFPFPTAGSLEVTAGVHVGAALGEAHGAVLAGVARSDEVTFLSGYLAWPLELLSQQVEFGQWTVARASPALLLGGGGRRGGEGEGAPAASSSSMHARISEALRRTARAAAH